MAFVKWRAWIGRLKHWRTEHWLALVAVSIAFGSSLISAAALGLSMYQAYLTRQFQHLSVQPHMYVEFDYNDSGDGWNLVSDGLGPARMRGFKVFIDGISQPATNYFPSIIEKAFPFPAGTKISFRNPRTGMAMKANDTAPLFWVSPGQGASILAAPDRIRFEICYCSIYDDCWLNKGGADITSSEDKDCSTFSKEPKSIWWNH